MHLFIYFAGITPIMFAAIQNNVHLFNLLISAGANVIVRNANDQSAGDIMDMHVTLPSPILLEQPRQNGNHLKVEDPLRHKKRSSIKKSHQKTEEYKQEPPAPITHQCPHNNPQCNRRCKDTVICQNADYHHHHHHSEHPMETIHVPHFYSPQVHRPVPMVYLSPQPMLFNQQPNEMHQQRPRKSSGVANHWCLMSPAFSPIMPSYNLAPQIFFPSDFNTGAVMSPVDAYGYPNDNSMLNHTVFQSPTNFTGYIPYNTDMEPPHA